MFNLIQKWNFPSNNYGQIFGIADSGVETFKGTPIKSLAREICQNSLDAALENDEPTRIEFRTFELDPRQIPDYNGLEDALNRALDFWSQQQSTKAKTFFKQALAVMHKPTITCLRISDFNTSGLVGSREEYNSPWCNLTKSSGASDKSGSNGGSFGIGKFAPYACSSLRTVFYSTSDKEGVCASQARFLRDLLLTSGEEAITKKVYFIDEDGIIEDQHLVTYACSSNNGTNFFLDPTWYNGTINSLEGSFNSADISEQHRSLLSILDVTQEEIESARNKVQEYLIERFQIKDISTQLGIDKASDLDKQIRMLTFMEKHLSPASGSLNCRSVVLGDREIECGKLLELFYKANNIPYILKCSGDKYNSAYITTIDGMESTIYPKVAFFSDRNNNPLSRKLHFAKNKKDENQYLWAFSDERRQQFMTSINKSRKIAATVIVPGQKLDTNLTTNRQFADTLKVDVSPVENSENTPAAVTQVVTHNDTTLGSDE